jgi:cytochrome c oxidase subunit 2
MRSTVHVLSAGAFQAWLARKKGGGAAAGGGGSTGATATAPAPTAGGASGSGDATAGKAIFTGAAGCGGCHKLADAGTSGATGPDLGQALKTFTPARIMESIVKPNAEIAKGYPANVMPQNFGQTLSPKQLKDLVAYLVKATR